MKYKKLGKTEKWVLTACYRLAVMLDRSGLEPLDGNGYGERCGWCAENGADKDYIVLLKDENDCITNYCDNNRGRTCDWFTFRKEDVLLSYFKLEKSPKTTIGRKQHFAYNDAFKRAHASLTRTLKSLENKGYIGIKNNIVSLTDEGAGKAAELLGAEYAPIG